MDIIKERLLMARVPQARLIIAPRIGTGPERVAQFYDQVFPALMSPLTALEMQTGIWTPPPASRIGFRGTLTQAQDFFQRTQLYMCGIPMTQWTDGGPIIVPTEAAVAQMLTGTSHPKDEVIKALGSTSPVLFQPMNWTATVEKVAVNAVMAGCSPKEFPVVLAESTSACASGTTTFWNQWQVVSGPIVKEIGMNYDIGVMEGQNIANACIGRAYQLMAANLGGAQVGKNRMNSMGSPFAHGVCFAENPDGLPPGWLGLNEEAGYTKDQSVILVANTSKGIVGNMFAPSSYRALQGSGTGGMATRLGVSGPPPAGSAYNWLAYYRGFYIDNPGPIEMIMVPEMAMDLWKYGFKTKQAAYEWLWNHSFTPMSQYKGYGWYDFYTTGGTKIEPTSGKPYGSLPDDYMVPCMGSVPFDNLIVIAGGAEEVALHLSDGSPARYNIYLIDPWR